MLEFSRKIVLCCSFVVEVYREGNLTFEYEAYFLRVPKLRGHSIRTEKKFFSNQHQIGISEEVYRPLTVHVKYYIIFHVISGHFLISV